MIGKFSIIFAVVIGIIRFKKIPVRYHPFVFLVWLALLNEILSSVFIYLFRNNAVNSNLYVLFEFLLIFWLFKNWGLFHKKQLFYKTCLFVLPLIWLLDTIIFHPVTRFSSWFRIIYSFVVVVCSMFYISNVFFSEKRNMLLNASFLISLTFLLYFSFKGLLEFFFLFNLEKSGPPSIHQFYHNIVVTMGVINTLSNFIFALALLWIPKKDTYTLPF